MGRSRDARKRHASQESEQSQQLESESDAPHSQQLAPHSQTNALPVKRKRHLWATHPIPDQLPLASSIPAAVLHDPVPDVKTINRQDSIRFLCEELCNNFTDEKLDDRISIDATAR
jgi:hypothetical protein